MVFLGEVPSHLGGTSRPVPGVESHFAHVLALVREAPSLSEPYDVKQPVARAPPVDQVCPLQSAGPSRQR
jgi:hypothetical protein